MFMILLSLALSGFLSATILPGSSEAAFVAYLLNYPDKWLVALLLLTAANSLGSVTSYLLTRFIPHKEPSAKTLERMKRYGTPLLFFSFLPIIGDALPLAAGFLRLSIYKCIFFITLGKFARYCIILGGVLGAS
ncbi:MAG: hypothetical protein LBV09_07660 [Deferribacteraceae bacterium]|jgi:membrane protein YqaA with SNARE-associated domain|nr:hypothetical protein [Deferribacteraceae bacterium]